MKENKESPFRRAVSGVAFAGALFTSQAGFAEDTQRQYVLPPSYIGEYMDAIRPDININEGRRYQSRHRRFNLDEDVESRLGKYVERGIERLGIGLPNEWEWRVDDDVRGTGFRIGFRIPLNLPEEK